MFWYDDEGMQAWRMWKGMLVVVKMEERGRGSLGGEGQREGDWMSVMWREQRRRHLAGPDGEDGLGPLWAVPTRHQPVYVGPGNQDVETVRRQSSTTRGGPGCDVGAGDSSCGAGGRSRM